MKSMQNSTLFREAHIVNEGEVVVGDVLVVGNRIDKVGKNLEKGGADIVNAKGLWQCLVLLMIRCTLESLV